MQLLKTLLIGATFLGGAPVALLADTVTLIHSSGQKTEIEISPTDRFCDVCQWLHSYFQEEGQLDPSSPTSLASNESVSLDLNLLPTGALIRAKQSFRDYKAAVTKSEKKDITYIVNTLAKESLIGLAKEKSKLKKVGDHIEHVHPLRFLMTVFTDEELKAGINAIRSRGHWVWDGFISGLTGSLSEESKRQNLTADQIQNFAQAVNTDFGAILSLLQQEKWQDFVNFLIDNIPRANDPNRYDM